ncbi:MAG: PKD domain-containing protein, partial [Candidatus Symbiothrix sp.]|jgi:PKD repeat protein|nr:PKD domain-containing protein [Candidatus Symbiothrix sp.]
VNCLEGADWQDQKKGVARTLTPVGDGYVSLCSGTLINNTSGNFDPLYLSAHHCFSDISAPLLNQMIFYFNYEYPECENLGTDPRSPTMTGAQLLVDLNISGSSDGALLRLNDSIPDSYNVYFNGWDRRDIPANSGVGIHHPAGDVKKISTYTATASTETWNGSGAVGARDAHWNVYFSATVNGRSVTEGGSSGSPLFNQNKLVVGTLTGGNSSCNYPNGINLYGKLWYHWDQGAQKMATYLDPDNIAPDTLPGIYLDYSSVNASFTLPPEEIYVIRPVEFTSTSRNALTWDWTFEGAVPAVSGEENPKVAFDTEGVHTVSLTVNKGTDTETTVSRNVEIILKEKICPEDTTVGKGTNYQSYPIGSARRQILSAALYTASEIGLEEKRKITHLSWQAVNASAEPRKMFIYMKETAKSSLERATWAAEIADAELVYESEDNWTNTAGWVTVPLQKPFSCSGEKNVQVMVRTLATGDSGENVNCYYSSSQGRHLYWVSDTTIVPADRGRSNSYRPNIRFRVAVPCGVDFPEADFLTGDFPIDEPAEYSVLDKITFTDRSSGPAVNWEWSFLGGTPESSSEENPVVVYNQAGTYPVTLIISNHLGKDTLERTLLIRQIPPLAAFSSSSDGFTAYPDHGPFLPYSGGTVSFRDESLYDPVSREWALEGITETVPPADRVTVNYPEGKNLYSARLTVGNSKGEDRKEIEGYVRVGGTAPVWNIPYGDAGDTYHLLSEGNYLSGSNSSYGRLAEKFTAPAGGFVTQADIMIKVFNSVSLNSRSYEVSVFEDADGKPGTVLSSVAFKGADINLSGYTRVVFPEPVAVTGNFYIELKGTGTVNTKIAVASSKESAPTVYVYIPQKGWESLEEFDPEKRKISLNIVPVFTYQEPTSLLEPVSKLGIRLYPNPVGDYLHIESESPLESILVSDLRGRRIQFINPEKDGNTIRASGWEKGIFIVKIRTQNDQYNLKVVKK